MSGVEYASAVHWTVEREPYADIPEEVRYASEFRYRVVSVEQPKPAKKRRRKSDSAAVVVVAFGLISLGLGVVGGVEAQRSSEPKSPAAVHQVPKPTHVKVYRFWINSGWSSTRIGV